MFFNHAFIPFFAVSIVVFANPVPYDSNDLIDTEQPSTEKISEVVSSDIDSNNEPVENDSTSSQMTIKTSPIYISDNGCDPEDITQKRNMFRRQSGSRSCPSGFVPTPRKPNPVQTPPSPSTQSDQQTQPKKATTSTDKNPCTEKLRSALVPTQSVHVTCGGPTVGGFLSQPNFVLNCVPGNSSFIATPISPIPKNNIQERPTTSKNVQSSIAEAHPFLLSFAVMNISITYVPFLFISSISSKGFYESQFEEIYLKLTSGNPFATAAVALLHGPRVL